MMLIKLDGFDGPNYVNACLIFFAGEQTSNQVIICHHKQMVIDCMSLKIQIISAHYGRTDIEACSLLPLFDPVITCGTDQNQEHTPILDSCQGLKKCSRKVSAFELGVSPDPCIFYLDEYLNVTYSCGIQGMS